VKPLAQHRNRALPPKAAGHLVTAQPRRAHRQGRRTSPGLPQAARAAATGPPPGPEQAATSVPAAESRLEARMRDQHAAVAALTARGLGLRAIAANWAWTVRPPAASPRLPHLMRRWPGPCPGPPCRSRRPARTALLRHRDPPGPGRRHRRAHPALQLRLHRRQRQPDQSDQTTDVRPRQPRPPAQTRHPPPTVITTTKFAPEPMLVAENPAERSHERGRRHLSGGGSPTGLSRTG
jgi:hypothetical protein